MGGPDDSSEPHPYPAELEVKATKAVYQVELIQRRLVTFDQRPLSDLGQMISQIHAASSPYCSGYMNCHK